MRTRYVIGFIVVVLSVLAIIYCIMVDTIPKLTYTRNCLTFWGRELYIYYEQHSMIPGSLQDIPKRGEYNYSLKDGWGNKIEYVHEPDGLIRLTSLGSDGSIGGTGEATDIHVIFMLNSEILNKNLSEFIDSMVSQMDQQTGK